MLTHVVLALSNLDWSQIDPEAFWKDLSWMLNTCRDVVEVDIDRIARCALFNSQTRICRRLVEVYGAQFRSRDLAGATAILYAAASQDCVLGFKLLVKTIGQNALAAELNHRDAHGRSAVHYSLYADPAALHLCLLHGLDTKLFERDQGESAWKVCISPRQQAVLLLHEYLKAELDVPVHFSGVSSEYRKISETLSCKELALVQYNDGKPKMEVQWVHVPSMNVKL